MKELQNKRNRQKKATRLNSMVYLLSVSVDPDGP